MYEIAPAVVTEPYSLYMGRCAIGVDLNVEKPCKMAPMRRGAAFTGRGIRAIIGCV